jgi:hypothetical protein
MSALRWPGVIDVGLPSGCWSGMSSMAPTLGPVPGWVSGGRKKHLNKQQGAELAQPCCTNNPRAGYEGACRVTFQNRERCIESGEFPLRIPKIHTV